MLMQQGMYVVVDFASEIPYSKFSYPLDVNMTALVKTYRKYGKVPYDPINVYPYKFTRTASKRCAMRSQTFDDVFLLFLIKSAIGNVENRNVIRQTWADEDFINPHVRRAFVLGQSNDRELTQEVEAEMDRYDDIVQLNFHDNYDNNTMKTIGGINWVTKYCSNAKFVMFVDDDFYVSTDQVVDYLTDLQRHNNADTLFMGYVNYHARPFRYKSSKWHVTMESYPFNLYPPYLSAGAVLLSMEFLKDIQIAIQYTRNFIIDDVYLGIVVYKLNVVPQPNDRIYLEKISYRDQGFNLALASHGYGNAEELHIAWNCGITKSCTYMTVFGLRIDYIIYASVVLFVFIFVYFCYLRKRIKPHD